jgi:glycine/D-amino acid oxidase-like deaminating enzyme
VWAYRVALSWLRSLIPELTPAELIRIPADDQEAARLERSRQRGMDRFREAGMSVTPLEADRVRPHCPELRLQEPGHAYRIAPVYVFSGAGLLARLEARLREVGLCVLSGSVERLEWTPSGWRAHTSWGCIRSSCVVLAPGAGLRDWFPRMPVQRYQGELLRLRFRPVPSVVLQYRGHLLPASEQEAWLGGVYRACDGPAFQTESSERLWRRFAELYPPLEEASAVELWSGLRLASADFRPLVGPVPGWPGLFLLGALGSRGLLWAPALGAKLARCIREDRPEVLPRWAATSRWPAEVFAPDPERLRR